MKRLVLAYAGLFLIGSAWGVSFPMVKIAVEGGYSPTGIMVLQLSMTVRAASSDWAAWHHRP